MSGSADKKREYAERARSCLAEDPPDLAGAFKHKNDLDVNDNTNTNTTQNLRNYDKSKQNAEIGNHRRAQENLLFAKDLSYKVNRKLFY